MRRLDTDEGAVAIFVAVALILVFGMGALVLDVGHMVWERRMLQNGADAAALAVAAECAEGLLDCVDDSVSVLGGAAEPYANDNSHDDESAVPETMPHGTDPTSCDPNSDDAPNPLTDSDTVKVSTQTLEGGESFLTHWLAPVLGYDTATVHACAAAGFGNLGGPVNVFPITICEEPHFNDLTNDGTDFGPPAEEIFFGKDECEFSTDTYDGGFGWLDLTEDAEIDAESGTCSVNVTEDRWYLGRTGTDTNNATYGECIEALYNYVEENGGEALIYVPIFSDYCSPNVDPCGGGEHKFYIEGFAGFEISGWGFNGGGPPEYKYPDASTCAGESPPVCIYGYFTEFVTYDGFINEGAGDFGGTTVQLLE